MPQLTPAGQQAINDISQRTGFSPDAVTSMLYSVLAGNGTMAQFNHPEFGGSGQWMSGGMIMTSDMFNNALKARIDNLCWDLSRLIQAEPGLTMSGSFQSQSQGGQMQGGQMQSGNFQAQNSSGPMGQTSLFVPGPSGGANWWPADLGSPASVGAQNSVRYAYFPGSRRLAIDLNGQLTVYDTLDNQIGGFSQQQSGSGSLTFTSQYGVVDVASLPVVSGAAPQAPSYAPPPPPPPPPAPAAPMADNAQQGEILGAIQKLGELYEKGFLSEAEFSAKKSELLGRL